MHNHIRKYARYCEIACMFIFPVDIIATIFSFLSLYFSIGGPQNIVTVIYNNFSQFQVISFCLLALFGVSLNLYSYIICIKLARLYQREGFFTAVEAQLWKQLSIVALITVFFHSIVATVYYNMLTPYVPELISKDQVLGITGGSIGAGIIFFCAFGFLWFIASLVAQATRIKKDQDLTI